MYSVAAHSYDLIRIWLDQRRSTDIFQANFVTEIQQKRHIFPRQKQTIKQFE